MYYKSKKGITVANGSPWLIVTESKQLTFGWAVAFFRFMGMFISYTEHYRKDEPCDRCHGTENST